MRDKIAKLHDWAPAPENNQKENEEAKPTTESILVNERNEEHYIASPSPAKSSISDIKPSDFYEEELHKWNSSQWPGECGTKVPISEWR